MELTALGLVEEALPIWKQLVEPRYLGIDTPTLLYCCREIRGRQVHYGVLRGTAKRSDNRDAIHLELNVLQEFHCFDRAVELMRGYLESAPETTLTLGR